MPDYSNNETRECEKRLGEFIFDQPVNKDAPKVILRGPYELDNGAVYHGEWSIEGLREGKGIQIWKDGSKYQGYWSNDRANG